jgi:UDP-3-O-[3-hydroxymyristoyl] glucosamine N-acyltransferase
MKLTQILKNSNLELIANKLPVEKLEVLHLSPAHELSNGALFFIAKEKYLKKVGQVAKPDQWSSVVLVLTQAMYDHLISQQHELLLQVGAIVVAKNIELAMCELSEIFWREKYHSYNWFVDGRKLGSVDISSFAEIASDVFIGNNVKIAEGVIIMPGCRVMGDITIEANTIIFPNVTIYPNVKIGKNCRIHAGSILGSDGFGYQFIQGQHKKIYQLGGVEIGANVEIGAACTIDSGAFGPTRIGDGCKFDNLVHIAHNCQVGKHVLFCAQTVLAGSVEVEDYAVFGGRVGVGPEAKIGKGAQFAGAAIVTDGAVVEPGAVMGGHPARPLKEWLKGIAYVRKHALKKD